MFSEQPTFINVGCLHTVQFVWGEIISEIEIICKIISPHTKCMVGATYIYKCRLLTELTNVEQSKNVFFFSLRGSIYPLTGRVKAHYAPSDYGTLRLA